MRERHPSSGEATVRGGSPRAMTAIGVFLFFGAVMASVAGTTLIWQGTFLDDMWTLNAPAYISWICNTSPNLGGLFGRED